MWVPETELRFSGLARRCLYPLEPSCWSLIILYGEKKDLCTHMWVWVSAVYVLVPVETQKGHWLSWSWSHRRLSAALCRIWTQVLWKSSKCFWPLGHLSYTLIMCFQLLQREHILEVGDEGIKLDITSLALMSHFMLDCINDLVGLSAVYEKNQ